MDELTALHQRLRLIAGLLDGTASMIRDAPLKPTNENIQRIGHALSYVFELQHAIYRLRPELEVPYEELPEEVREANRRLGQTLVAAYEHADRGDIAAATALLEEFISHDLSADQRELAKRELERLKGSHEA